MPTPQLAPRDLVANHVFVNQSALIEALLGRGLVDWDEVENVWADCAYLDAEPCPGCIQGSGCENHEPKEIYEWWAVSDWLLEKLRGQGEPVLDCEFGRWWGRTTTGQVLYLDGVIEAIFREVA